MRNARPLEFFHENPCRLVDVPGLAGCDNGAPLRAFQLALEHFIVGVAAIATAGDLNAAPSNRVRRNVVPHRRQGFRLLLLISLGKSGPGEVRANQTMCGGTSFRRSGRASASHADIAGEIRLRGRIPTNRPHNAWPPSIAESCGAACLCTACNVPRSLILQ
jgi:hypothetical protein